jgi:hypothetical protein
MKTKGLTRREFLHGAALTGVGLLAAACGEGATATAGPTLAPTKPAKDKIVVGMSRPLSGPLAVIGDSAFKPIYETFTAEVNAYGGVYVEEYGKKLPIELKIYDASDVGNDTR